VSVPSRCDAWRLFLLAIFDSNAVDIHPPLVKLIYAWVLHAQGFVGARETQVQWWSTSGNIVGTSDYKLVFEAEYGKPYIAMRMVAAVAGAALVPVMFLTSRALGLGRMPSLLAATFVLCETISALQVSTSSVLACVRVCVCVYV
jgi:dolichyl-phosphate-mannose--protein O-mannosyl transferase